jgi:preprotein translocase subunit YajC
MDIVSLAPILLLVVAFYFLLIRPQRNRAKAQQAMIAAIRPGARVMTTAGIFGTVVAVSEEVMSIEIAPGIAMEVLPAAVARVIEPVLADGEIKHEQLGPEDL